MDSTSLRPQESWAVLVGINWYSDSEKPEEDENLEGCINDIPQDHIAILLSDKAQDGNDPNYPTRTNVLKAIDNFTNRTSPGDLFYFHYSGHGDRVKTKHPDIKPAGVKDEILCTLEEDITDVEFGRLLDRLVEEKKLVVFPEESHFYRSRGYNLNVAAQSHEKAREYTAVDSKTYGRMTYHLLQVLEELKSSAGQITYGRLQDVLEAKCKAVARRARKKQRPMFLGDRNRLIFTTKGPDPGPCSLTANIIDVIDTSTVNLNKDVLPVAEVELTEVHGLESVAVLIGNLSANLSESVGWFAKLSERVTLAKASFQLPHNNAHATMDSLRASWSSYVDRRFPIELRFDVPEDGIDIFVETDNQYIFHFRDGHNNQMSHVPRLHADRPDSCKKLMELLKHLFSYQIIANLTHSTCFPLPSYEFKVVPKEEPDRGSQDSLSSWEVRFKIKHSSTLYVTALNLTMSYGVYQILSSYTQIAGSQGVERRKTVPELILKIVCPEYIRFLTDGAAFQMRDIIKIIVSTEPTSFYEYLLPDLQPPINPDGDSDTDSDAEFSDESDEESDNSGRDRRAEVREARVVAKWFVDQLSIDTEIK
ncbi:hypothetical protein Hte_007118 [Hypoxylon texense]